MIINQCDMKTNLGWLFLDATSYVSAQDQKLTDFNHLESVINALAACFM